MSAAADMLAAVIAALDGNPDATARDVLRAVHGRDSEVLRLLRLVRAAGVVEPPTKASRAVGNVASGPPTCPGCGCALDVQVRRAS